MTNFAPLNANQPVIDESGRLAQQARTWANNVTDESVLTGSGSPEGVVSAGVSRLYVDVDAAAGDILYVKRLSDIGGNDKNGWRAV